jgi:long-chain fatty acid transport protein
MKTTACYLLAALLLPFSAEAGTYNYRPILIGERALGFGGAYTALSNSGEGGYYNPAGLAFIDRATLSVAGNLYNLTRGSRKSALKFAGDEGDLSQNALNSVPQIASFAKKIRFPWESADGDPANTIAFNVVATEQLDLFGRVDFDLASGKALLTRSIQDRTLYVGPSYARRIGDRLSVGLSAFYILRQIENSAFLFDNDAVTLGQGFLQDRRIIGNFAIKAGIRFALAEDLWVGLTFQPRSIRFHSDGSVFSSTLVQDKSTSTVVHSINDQQNLSPNDPVPHTFGLGFAYERKRSWAVAADMQVHAGDSFDLYTDIPSEVERETVVNFSLGGEYHVRPDLPIRLGFFTNFSSAPTIRNGVGGQTDHVDLLGFSLTGSIESGNTSITAGTILGFGEGEGIDNQKNRIDVSQNTYGIVLAGSYKF